MNEIIGIALIALPLTALVVGLIAGMTQEIGFRGAAITVGLTAAIFASVATGVHLLGMNEAVAAEHCPQETAP